MAGMKLNHEAKEKLIELFVYGAVFLAATFLIVVGIKP